MIKEEVVYLFCLTILSALLPSLLFGRFNFSLEYFNYYVHIYLSPVMNEKFNKRIS